MNNRSHSRSKATNLPDPDTIRMWRRERGLSSREAGALVYVPARTWQRWEAGERAMHPAMWELAQIKGTEVIFYNRPLDPEQIRQLAIKGARLALERGRPTIPKAAIDDAPSD